MDVDSERVHGGNLDGPSPHHPGVLLQNKVLNAKKGTLASEVTMHAPTCEINHIQAYNYVQGAITPIDSVDTTATFAGQ